MKTDNSVDSAAIISLGELERQLKGALRPESATNFDILLPEHFVSIARGATQAQNNGPKHECRIEILANGDPGPGSPSAVFGSRSLSWLDALEVVLVQAAKRTLMWRRKGREAEVSINGKTVGRIELGWLLRHANIGSGRAWFDGEPFCQFVLPLRKPSAPQTSDCTGRFTFSNDKTSISFLICPKDSGNPQSAIFDPADIARLSHISDDQRLLLLALAIWPWSLYKAAKKKAAKPK